MFRPPKTWRKNDPVTSELAGKSVKTTLTDNHFAVIDLLKEYGPLTDDQLADIIVRKQIVDRHERARRLIRTLRENHQLIVPSTNEEGIQWASQNESGRWALMWEIADAEV